MNVRSRLKKLEEAADTGFRVILPNAYRADGTAITEHGQRDELACLVYPGEVPLRIDREEDEGSQEFEDRAEWTAKAEIKDTFVLGWGVRFL